MSHPSASVIVPAYNAVGTIGRCVTALMNQDYPVPYEVIVIDDGSSDGTAGAARAAGARVLLQPRGRPAAARNAGIRAARGAIVCCTDADCIPRGDWLREITAPFADVSVMACKGSYTTRQRERVARFVQLEYEDKYDLLRKQATIDFIDTYAAAYRRDVLLRNGGFDESFTYLEDQELSFRLAALGYRMIFKDTAVVEHLHSATLRDYMRKKATIGYWKAQVIRRHPDRLVRDSHTPQVMKLQMILMALLIAFTGVGLLLTVLAVFRGLEYPAVALAPAGLTALLFLLTTLPFVRKAWSRDRSVALLSPWLLAARGMALGWGYGLGIVAPDVKPGSPGVMDGRQRIAKRAIDVAGAIVGLIFTLLALPLIAFIIKLDSEGPLLFRQQRVGAQGRAFTLVKFRSMQVDAAERWPELITELGLKEPVLKLADDPRLTRAGRFLRRWSLDELPQFWNVMKGEMSLVGPRPEEPRIVAHYADWHIQRLAVKPGMTGLMQVSGRADLSLDDRVHYDLDYIANFSLRGDISILLRTLPAIVRGNGAH